MKKGSGSEFQQNKAQKNKKTDILDLDKYRTKKLETQNNSTQKIESEKKQKSTPSFESKVIRMDLHKKRCQSPYEDTKFYEEEPTKTFDSKEKETQVINLNDYRERRIKRKWKKDIFINTAQVAGMTFLFLFMLMNLTPSLKGTDSKMAKADADWFQAPTNKGIVIRGGIARGIANETPGADKPCTPSIGENPIKGMKKINPKNCIIDKL